MTCALNDIVHDVWENLLMNDFVKFQHNKFMKECVKFICYYKNIVHSTLQTRALIIIHKKRVCKKMNLCASVNFWLSGDCFCGTFT